MSRPPQQRPTSRNLRTLLWPRPRFHDILLRCHSRFCIRCVLSSVLMRALSVSNPTFRLRCLIPRLQASPRAWSWQLHILPGFGLSDGEMAWGAGSSVWYHQVKVEVRECCFLFRRGWEWSE